MADGVTADLSRRPRLRLQVGHGLDARHARLPGARPGPPQVSTTTRSPSAGSTPSPRTSSCRCRTTRSCTGRARCSARCRATTGRSSPTCACSSATSGPQPGKKLLFMGGELAQCNEWNHDTSLDWHLLAHAPHQGVQRWVRDLNTAYRSTPALHELDCDPEGFAWIDCNDSQQSTFAYLRRGHEPHQQVVVACNFTPVARHRLPYRRAARRLVARAPQQRCAKPTAAAVRAISAACRRSPSPGTATISRSWLRCRRSRLSCSARRRDRPRRAHALSDAASAAGTQT